MANEITDYQQYLTLLSHMDMLFDDYEANKPQIDLLTPVLKKYEDNDVYFASFNQSIADISNICKTSPEFTASITGCLPPVALSRNHKFQQSSS